MDGAPVADISLPEAALAARDQDILDTAAAPFRCAPDAFSNETGAEAPKAGGAGGTPRAGAMIEGRAQTFHVVTVVWGQPYVELFLDVALPNQMTPGNLGALRPGSRYRVFTAPEDVETLAASPLLGRSTN